MDYIDTLMRNFVLHPDFFWRYVQNGIVEVDRDLLCVFQVGDEAFDIGGGVAFQAKSNMDNPALIPDLYFFMERGYAEFRERIQREAPSWEDRRSVAFWRGSSTGIFEGHDTVIGLTQANYEDLPRFRLCRLSAMSPDLVDARITHLVQAANPEEAQAISGRLQADGMLADPIPQEMFSHYKFQIDIDGNTNAWGLLKKFSMGSCILKVASPWKQWFYDALQPWEHYVPVASDLSDLFDNVRWCKENDDKARRIAENGRRFAERLSYGVEMRKAAETILRQSIGA